MNEPIQSKGDKRKFTVVMEHNAVDVIESETFVLRDNGHLTFVNSRDSDTWENVATYAAGTWKCVKPYGDPKDFILTSDFIERVEKALTARVDDWTHRRDMAATSHAREDLGEIAAEAKACLEAVRNAVSGAAT